MDKKYLHHQLTRIRAVQLRYLFVPFLVVGLVTVLSLRANNLHMIQLRNAVYAADKANGDTEGTLQRLRSYVYGHMNTELSTGDNVYPPVQLKYTYQRLQQAEEERVKNANAGLYTAAQAYCEQQNPVSFSGRTRVPCIESYVTSHTTQVRTIPSAMYKFDFVSPAWSPDLAGWSLLLSLALLLLLIVRVVAAAILKQLTA